MKRNYCFKILSPYRESFNVSFGFCDASCASPWSRPYFLMTLGCLRSFPLARLEAAVSPKLFLAIILSCTSCTPPSGNRAGGRGRCRRRSGNPRHALNNSVTNTAHEVSGGRNRNDHSAMPNPRHSDAGFGSMICAK